jgi:hypothetical protein
MNNDLTILPIVPEEFKNSKNHRELHPNLPNPYRGQLVPIIGGVRTGKSVLWNNWIHNKNFFEDLFDTVAVVSPTAFNDSSSRFTVAKYRDTVFDKYDDKIIKDLIENQKRKKKIEGEDTGYCLIVDDCYNEFNKRGGRNGNGGELLKLASRFRHYVNPGDPVMFIYSTQKYLDLIPMIRANATGLMVSGMIKNKKELDTLRYDLDDTFGGRFDEFMTKAKVNPYSWLYFRMDSTPPEVFLNFKEKLF